MKTRLIQFKSNLPFGLLLRPVKQQKATEIGTKYPNVSPWPMKAFDWRVIEATKAKCTLRVRMKHCPPSISVRGRPFVQTDFVFKVDSSFWFFQIFFHNLVCKSGSHSYVLKVMIYAQIDLTVTMRKVFL
jgi:hypothetical protein